MFCIDTTGLPAIDDYASALKHWEKIKAWRGYPEQDPRPLDASRKAKHKTIHLKANGDIALRLHTTDVVTYHPDGSVTLRPWSSRSTDEFARALIPVGMTTWFNHAQFTLVGANANWYTSPDEARWYAIPASGMRFTKSSEGQWVPDKIAPVTCFKVNRKRANAALKSAGFDKFKTWYDAYSAMNQIEFDDSTRFAGWVRSFEAVAMLADRDKWTDLARYVYRNGVEAMRRYIIKDHGALDVVTLGAMTTKELRAAERSVRQWQFV